jgi:hypothetical protein
MLGNTTHHHKPRDSVWNKANEAFSPGFHNLLISIVSILFVYAAFKWWCVVPFPLQVECALMYKIMVIE